MALRQPTPAPDDPRLSGHETTYQASRGGHYPPPPAPAPANGSDSRSTGSRR